jgi:hypothetical protein
MSQVEKMRAQWEANPRSQNGNKRQKTNNNHNKNNNKGGNQNKSDGDFHTLLDKVEKVKESLEKALKQQQSTIRKKERDEEKHVSFANGESEEKADANFNPDSFHLELDQLSISNNDPDDFNGQDE